MRLGFAHSLTGGDLRKACKKQQQLFQEQFAKIQSEMQNSDYEGTAGNGLVKIILSGDKNIKSIKIDPECVDKDDVEGLEDLLLSAFKNAADQLEERSPMNNLGLNPLNLL